MTETTHTVELERAATLSLIRCLAGGAPLGIKLTLLTVADEIEKGLHLQHHAEHADKDELAEKAQEMNVRLREAGIPGARMKEIVAPMLVDALLGKGGPETFRGFIERGERALAEHQAASAPPAEPTPPEAAAEG